MTRRLAGHPYTLTRAPTGYAVQDSAGQCVGTLSREVSQWLVYYRSPAGRPWRGLRTALGELVREKQSLDA